MAPGFDALASNPSVSQTTNAYNGNNNNPDLLYSTDSRSFQNLLSTLKITSEQETWLLDIILKRSVTMYRANATDEKKMIGKSAALLGKLDNGGSIGADGLVLSQSLQACKMVQQNILESSSDHLAIELFLRDTAYRNLNTAAKHRENRLKERVKSIQGLLSKLENVEKSFIRALTDLKDEERKNNYLLGRKELDISEEVEKIEIDLRKSTSQLAIKQAEYDVVKSRLLDIQRSWRDEWHGFRIYTRTLELERKAEIQNALLALARSSILIKQAEIARQVALIQQLEEQDLLSELNNIHHFSTSTLGHLDAALPSSMNMEAIIAKIWPGGSPPLYCPTAGADHPSMSSSAGFNGQETTPAHRMEASTRRPPLDAEQLASISRPGRPPALNIRQRDAATYASYKSSADNQEKGGTKPNSAPAMFVSTPVPLSASLSASSSASSGSSTSASAASTPRSTDFPIPPGSGRKSFDSPIFVNGTSSNREYGEEMFSVRRKAVPKESPVVLDKYGRSTTTPSRNLVETPTKPSAYRSPHRNPLDALLFTSSIAPHTTNNEVPSHTQGNTSATPTAFKASLLLSRQNAAEESTRKVSKPLPGLPAGRNTMIEGGAENTPEDDGEAAIHQEITPPSLPSFSNLKLSEMRMSGMWFAQP